MADVPYNDFQPFATPLLVDKALLGFGFSDHQAQAVALLSQASLLGAQSNVWEFRNLVRYKMVGTDAVFAYKDAWITEGAPDPTGAQYPGFLTTPLRFIRIAMVLPG